VGLCLFKGQGLEPVPGVSWNNYSHTATTSRGIWPRDLCIQSSCCIRIISHCCQYVDTSDRIPSGYVDSLEHRRPLSTMRDARSPSQYSHCSLEFLQSSTLLCEYRMGSKRESRNSLESNQTLSLSSNPRPKKSPRMKSRHGDNPLPSCLPTPGRLS